MINIKDQVYKALDDVYTGHVSDLYPTDWTKLPAIQYSEEANNVYTWTDDEEKISYVRYRVDIWDTASTSQTAINVNDALAALGLIRIECQDAPDPSGLRHKQMRFEAEIGIDEDAMYWTGNQ